MSWPQVPLESLAVPDASIVYGILKPGPNTPGGIPYVRPTEMGYRKINMANVLRTTPEMAAQFRRSTLRTGDLILTIVGTIGKIAFVPPELDGGNITQCSVRIRPDKTRVEGRFLSWALESPSVCEQYDALRFGSGVPRLNVSHVRGLQIPLPPLPEQRRIADILDKADAIRRKRKEAITLTEDLLRSTFLEMFGDPVTNPKGWPTISISDVVDNGGSLVDGPFGSALKPDQYVPMGVRVIRNFNVNSDWFDASDFRYILADKFEQIRRSEVQTGDVLMTTKGTVGDICLMPELPGPSVLSATGTVRLRLPLGANISNEFVVSQMIMPSYQEYLMSFAAGSAQQYLNLSAIRKMRLLLPPVVAQSRFLGVRRRNRDLRQRLESAHGEAANMFKNLLHRAFRGELTASSS